MKFKTILTLSLFFIFYGITQAQTSQESSNTGEFGISIAPFGSSGVTHFGKTLGTPGYDGDTFFSVGIIYIHPWKNWLDIETAVGYTKHQMKVTPHFNPGSSTEPYFTDVSLIDIPISLRANFLQIFYANSGVLFDIDISQANAVDNQSGIGWMAGLGANYEFDSGTSIFVNPYVKLHSIFPFSAKRSTHQRVLEAAIRFGVTYKF
ncbi:hypothetical protein [Fodinibius halophilus]|uniref:Outer membrane protein beta-barrel domain-containing protein n=1 Tax=Fodinibius halophilus TaxID=1736908 RepID=A0A6M1TD46_9BACT|nr:hypothetical protein [Fodinibius halophilus]NGP89941.1 hypothetical protein [Fodinibius halophilus]